MSRAPLDTAPAPITPDFTGGDVFQSKPCRACGDVFAPTGGRHQYCQPCGIERKREWDRAWPNRPNRPWTKTCLACGGKFKAVGSRGRCLECKPPMRRVARVRPTECPLPWASCLACHEVFLARRRTSHNDACRYRLLHRPTTRQCRCGTTSPPLLRTGGWTCEDCKRQRKAAKRRREPSDNHRARARRYGVEYLPLRPDDIFVRDGWTCYLCGCQTIRTKEHHDSRATLDHVVPMSKGGAHTPDNVRCACWTCNTLKGDKDLILT